MEVVFVLSKMNLKMDEKRCECGAWLEVKIPGVLVSYPELLDQLDLKVYEQGYLIELLKNGSLYGRSFGGAGFCGVYWVCPCCWKAERIDLVI